MCDVLILASCKVTHLAPCKVKVLAQGTVPKNPGDECFSATVRAALLKFLFFICVLAVHCTSLSKVHTISLGGGGVPKKYLNK